MSKVVFLWLASWKNGMSSYAPVWVKQDTKRFPRVVQHGVGDRDAELRWGQPPWRPMRGV